MAPLGMLRPRPSGPNSLTASPARMHITCVAVGVVNQQSLNRRNRQDGTTWTTLDQPTVIFLTLRFVFNVHTCVAVGIASAGGATSICNTADFTSWQPPLDPFRISANSSRRCPNETTCIARRHELHSTPYAVGTSNNGSTWSSQSPPANAIDLTGISCSAAEDCVAVGSTGNTGAGSTIMGTTTGGLSWTSQNAPAGTGQLNSVSCPTTADCFAVGRQLGSGLGQRGYAWSSTVDPSRRSVASMPSHVQRPRTALRSGSASSAALSSSAPSTRVRAGPSESFRLESAF